MPKIFVVLFFQHGESEFNLKGRIGGDSDLSPHGWRVWKSCFELFCLYLSRALLVIFVLFQFAESLGEFVNKQNLGNLKVDSPSILIK